MKNSVLKKYQYNENIVFRKISLHCVLNLCKNKIDIERVFRQLPPLIKAYIRVGAWIGPGAIVDSKFNTTDVLIVLNSKKILKKYAQLSFEKIH